MNSLKNLIVALVGLSIAVAVSVLVMIHGWGLEPRSWTWIIIISILGQLLAQVFIEIAKSKDN